MGLFSLFYAPLNCVFEILWGAGASRTGTLVPVSGARAFVLAQPSPQPLLAPGYPFLCQPAWLGDECSACYCYLFSLFFFLPCSHHYFECFLFSLPLKEAIKFPRPCVVWCALTNYH